MTLDAVLTRLENRQTATIADLVETRLCTGCKVEKPLFAFYHRNGRNPRYVKYQCKTCELKKNKARKEKLRISNPELFEKNLKKYSNKSFKQKYGMDVFEIQEMLNAQFRLCANRACGKEISLTVSQRDSNRAYVDHCHTIGKVRALLCLKCNTALGILEQKNLVLGLTEYLNKYGHTEK